MVASPEICRINGAKSRGPITQRGKAVASRNATKHGLLAKLPPLLVTEDLTTFEGLVQGLIDQYQPENPVEHFLIQQVAMGMFKQYRLWSAEAAISNLEILKAKKLAKFPDHVTPAKVDLADFIDFQETRSPLKDLLEKEAGILQGLIADLRFDCSHTQDRGETKTLTELSESLGQNYYYEDRKALVWQYQDELEQWLTEARKISKKRSAASFEEAIARVNRLLELAQQRLGEIAQTMAEIESTEQAIERAEVDCKGMQQQELFSRYQRDVNRELYAALDRLEEIQQRKNGSSIGSFRETS
jgi:hypothetical protein